MKKLPLFEFIIDDSKESGVKTVSIVTDPAFGSHAVYFKKDRPKFIAFEDKKKQIVAGLSLIPDLPVYRYDAETDLEFEGYFSKETIEKIVEKFHEEMLQNQVNLDHNPNSYIDAFLIEDFIVNTDARVQDLKAKGIEHANIMGAWFTAFKIKDPEIFKAIIDSGEKTGFSVESFIDRVLVDFHNEVKNNILNKKVKSEMKKNNKSIKEKILSIFAEIEKFERMLVPELAFEIEWTVVGEPVNKVVVNENGDETLQPIGKGEFNTEAGIIVVDEASNLVEVRDLPADPADNEPEVPASGATSGSTETIIAAVSGETVTSTGTTETVTGTTLGIQKSLLEIVGTTDGDYTVLVKVQNGVITEASAQALIDLMLAKHYNFGDMEKRLKELIPNNRAGSYTINVDVNEDGEYIWGSISTWSALKFHDEKQVQELLNKIAEPITDPILSPEAPAVDFNKLTQYEKLMYKKGLKAV